MKKNELITINGKDHAVKEIIEQIDVTSNLRENNVAKMKRLLRMVAVNALRLTERRIGYDNLCELNKIQNLLQMINTLNNRINIELAEEENPSCYNAKAKLSERGHYEKK